MTCSLEANIPFHCKSRNQPLARNGLVWCLNIQKTLRSRKTGGCIGAASSPHT